MARRATTTSTWTSPFYQDNKIELNIGVAATAIDRAAHQVELADGRRLGYEKLLLATGGAPIRLPLPGADLAGVMTLRTIEDSEAIRAAAAGEATAAARRAVVLGGSFIGSEVAASLAQMGMQVTMVFPEARLLERLGPPELSAALAARFAEHGVTILSGALPAQLQGAGRGRTSGPCWTAGCWPAELVVMGVGIRLNTALAKAAGLALGERDAVLVDENLVSSDPDILAAGDIAAWPDPLGEGRLRVEHWDVARRQGTRAGGNMAGEARPYTALPYFFSDLFDLSLEVWGEPTGGDDHRPRRTASTRFTLFASCGQADLGGGCRRARARPQRRCGLVEARTPTTRGRRPDREKVDLQASRVE